MEKLSESRKNLLYTRALLCLHIQVPHRDDGDGFEWHMGSADVIPADARWFIDGSLFDGKWSMLHSTGFGIAAVGPGNSLIAYGAGRPPAWVKDAAGAEAWALAVVISMCPEMPHTVTDCYNLLTTLGKGKAIAVNAKSPLARIWAKIFDTLECTTCSDALLQKLKWMPAHGASSSIGRALDSNGNTLTAVEWRANRLVDALAKMAAKQKRVPTRLTQLVEAAAEAVEFYAARLGRVTFEANHFRRDIVLPDGTTTHTTVRDSTAVRQPKAQGTGKNRRTVATDVAPLPPAIPIGIEVPISTSSAQVTRQKKRKRDDDELRKELRFKQHQLENRRILRPSTLPPAQQRMAELRERVVARYAAERDCREGSRRS